MAITTWFREEEQEKMTKTGDSDINELLDEINAKMRQKFLVRENKIFPKRGFFTSWFKESKPYFIYRLFAHIQGMECQVINFCQDHEGSLNTHVRKSYIITYLLGILSGLEKQTLAEPPTTNTKQ